MKVGTKLKGRSLLNLDCISNDDMLGLIDLAISLKKLKRRGRRGNLLRRKNIALIFEKSSTRTRCATVVAAADEGGRTEYLAADGIHLGKKESVADTAKVLGRMFDAIMFRGSRQDTVELLARHSGIPVWNGLTDDFHPTQVLADLMTVKEHFGKLKGLRLVYLGDGRNNVANSLMLGCAKAGLHFVNATPKSLTPGTDLVRKARSVAEGTGATITIESDPQKAVRGANIICTDVWASMGEEAKLKERIRLLRPYQVNMKLMQATGNLEAGKVIFLHCLPAFHDNNTVVTRSIGAMEVTDDVFQAPFSLVFDEAENRVHTIKALMVATLA
jgi:ornithine carbamoyltransferase